MVNPGTGMVKDIPAMAKPGLQAAVKDGPATAKDGPATATATA
jgi:hypothetical protein